MGRLLALIVALAAATAIAWAAMRPPASVEASATGFSAVAAMADVRAIASRPHPVGSAENLAVADYLLRRMSALGLESSVHDGVGVQPSKWQPNLVTGANVRNLVGILPGRDRSAAALVLMAHYDSVPGSPGAADDAAGVAAALQIVERIKAQGVPARDVLVLLTDGEEAGLLGANAFFARDPLAKRVGFVINLEARGSSGRVQMFQTGPNNGEAVRLLASTAARPQASSLSGFIYEKMPNDTDFSEALRAGVGGLNFAFAGRQFDYHSPTATPANLDPRTLQDLGDQGLAAARAAAFAQALPKPAPSLAYSHLFGDVVLAYPPIFGWLLLAVTVGLIVLGVERARRIEPLAWRDVGRGAWGALFSLLGACAVLHFARRATGAGAGYMDQRLLLAQSHHWEAALVLLGVGFYLWCAAEMARGRRNLAIIPLAAGLASCLFGGFDKIGLGLGVVAAVIGVLAYGRPVSRTGAWAGVLLAGVVGALAAQVFAPTAAIVIAWPLALASVAAAATALGARKSYASLAACAILAAIGGGWVGGYVHASYISLDLVELVAASLFLALPLFWPLAQCEDGAPPARLVGPLLMAGGFVALLIVRLHSPYDSRFPQVAYVSYQLDQDARRAWRYSPPEGRTPWSDTVLRGDGGKIRELRHWSITGPVAGAPARWIEQTAPPIELTKLGDGRLRLHLAAPPGARRIGVQLLSETPAQVESVGGVPLSLAIKPGAPTRLRWEAGPQGVDAIIRPEGPGTLLVRYAATQEHWPAAAVPLPRRPAAVMGFDVSDSTVIVGTRRFAW